MMGNEQRKKGEAILHFINSVYDRLIILALVVLMLFGLYTTYDAWYVRYVSSGSALTAYRPTKEEPEVYLKLGPECIGWITIDDAYIDYPLMQGKDNTKYLNTGPDGKYSLAGSIFLDWQCDPELKEGFGLIFGHHMSSKSKKKPGPMFGALDWYNEKEWFDTHRTGTITLKGKEQKLDVFAFTVSDANQKIIFDPTNHTGQGEWIKENAIYYVEPKNPDRLVALATCKDPSTTERTLLFCSIYE